MKLLLTYVFDYVFCWSDEWEMEGAAFAAWNLLCSSPNMQQIIFKVGVFQLPLTRWTCIASIVHLTFNTLPCVVLQLPLPILPSQKNSMLTFDAS